MAEKTVNGIKIEFNIGKDDIEIEERKGTLVAKIKDDELFLKEAKENGFKKEDIKKLDDFRHAYLEKALEATTQIALDVLPEYPDAKRLEMSFPYGARKRDSLKTFVITDASVPNRDNPSERKPAVLVKAKAQFEATKVSSNFIKGLRNRLEEKFING